MLKHTRKIAFVIFLALYIGDLTAAEEPKAGVQDGHPALFYSACFSKSTMSVTYTKIGNEEAFRVPVMQIHHTKFQRSCQGYLYVTPTRVVYDASVAPNTQDALDLPKSDVKLRTRPAYDDALEIDTANRPYRFWLVADKEGDKNRYVATCNRNNVWRWIQLAFDDFPRARTEFAKLVPGVTSEVSAEAQISNSTKALRALSFQP